MPTAGRGQLREGVRGADAEFPGEEPGVAARHRARPRPRLRPAGAALQDGRGGGGGLPGVLQGTYRSVRTRPCSG